MVVARADPMLQHPIHRTRTVDEFGVEVQLIYPTMQLQVAVTPSRFGLSDLPEMPDIGHKAKGGVKSANVQTFCGISDLDLDGVTT
jgi:hypothetical protein